MPDRNIQSYHLACKLAPWSCTVNNHVEFVFCSIVRLKSFYLLVFYDNLCYLHAGLHYAAVLLELLCICVGDHRSVKVSVVRRIACAKNVVR